MVMMAEVSLFFFTVIFQMFPRNYTVRKNLLECELPKSFLKNYMSSYYSGIKALFKKS